MYRIALLFCWFICGSIMVSPPAPRAVFGVRIAFQANSDLTTFACFIAQGNVLTNKKILTKTEFIQIASGNWPSIYNPNRINYFEERQLNCGMFEDSFEIKPLAVCIPIDSLWKLRFSTYPYRSSGEMGWSSKLYRPSEKQELYLFNNYNVRSIDENFFLDTNFWKLLSDVQDPVWIANYKSLQ
ncbi:MAG: hypothetical protein RIT43_2071 [Bacteroidota bacterium]